MNQSQDDNFQNKDEMVELNPALTKERILKHNNIFVIFLSFSILISAWLAISKIEKSAKVDLEITLNAVLKSNHNSIHSQLIEQKRSVTTWASYAPILPITEALLDLPQNKAALINSHAQKTIRALMKSIAHSSGYHGFFIINRDFISLASSRDSNIGTVNLIVQQSGLLEKVLSGETIVSLPQPSDVPLEDINGNIIKKLPTMFAASPIKNSDGDVIAILTFRLDPDELFGSVFKTGLFGNTGETYAFNSNGFMISESHFKNQLIEVGLLTGNHSGLSVEIRNPNVNMVLGEIPSLPRNKQPLTYMAQHAVSGKSGLNLSGYNDYRGVPVVGAWVWDDVMNFGIATEIDKHEAFSSFQNTRFIIILFALLAVSVLIVFAIASSINRKKIALTEEKYQNSINSTIEGYWIIDVEGRILEVNKALCDMLESTPNKLIGKYAWEFISDRNQILFDLKTNKINTTKHHTHKTTYTNKQGEVNYVQINATSLFNNNIFTGAFAFISDITELEEARIEADRANHAKSEFLSSMSHELRTPLNAIHGFGQLLRRNPTGLLTDSQIISIDHILNGGKHLITLIDEILDLSHIESGKLELLIDNISLVDIINECLALMSVIADQQKIDILISDSVNENLNVCVNYTRFKQVLINLISNAIKYNHENGKVTISVEETANNMLRISITDTGWGIPEDKLIQLFNPFNRLGIEQSGIEGAGIGLVVCKNLIELMDGAIGVKSEVGKGSTFWIEVPLANQDNLSTIKNETSDVFEQELPDINGTLLYVEDNQTNIKLIESVVSEIEGLTLTCAHTGKLGIEQAKNIKPDIIILDINLPDISGIEVLKELRCHSETRSIPILAMSAAATKKDIKIGLEAGFLQYLTKPINIVEVLDAINSSIKTA